MKTKKLNKKLSLNKKTIGNLDERSLHAAKGGAYETISCNTRCIAPISRCVCLTFPC